MSEIETSSNGATAGGCNCGVNVVDNVIGDCQCQALPRDVTDLITPLFQANGGRLYRLLLLTRAKAVEMNDGSSVETRINLLERNLAANTTLRFSETIAHRDALTGWTSGDLCYVFDASGDAAVDKGGAMYVWLPTHCWKKVWSTLEGLNIIRRNGGLDVDEDGRIYVDFAKIPIEQKTAIVGDLISAGGGLAADASGRIYVAIEALDLAQLTAAQIKKLTPKLIKAGGGLKTDADGLLWVDFASMTPANKTTLVNQLVRTGSGLTIDSDGKIAIDYAALAAGQLKINGGILSDNGRIYIDSQTGMDNARRKLFSAGLAGTGIKVNQTTGVLEVALAQAGAGLSQTELASFLAALIGEGGGLAVDENGKLIVDFSKMGMERITDLMNSLHVPLWCGESTFDGKQIPSVFNVGGPGATDAASATRIGNGAKAFATIQACIDYVSRNFNVTSRTVSINVANGSYAETLTLPNFSRTSGKIVIRGETAGGVKIEPQVTSRGQIVSCIGGEWELADLTFNPSLDLSGISSGGQEIMFFANGGNLTLRRHLATVTFSANPARSVTFQMYAATSGSKLTLYPGSGPSQAKLVCGASISNVSARLLYAANNGQISFSATHSPGLVGQINVSGPYSIIAAASGGRITSDVISLYPEADGDSYAKLAGSGYGETSMYSATSGGCIDMNGNALLGNSSNCEAEAASYSWYKA